MAPYVGYLAVVQMLVVRADRVRASCAGILYLRVQRHVGGHATFKQLFAVVVHTGPIGVLAQLFTVPMNYAAGLDVEQDQPRGVPADDRRTSFLGRLLGTIDLFLIWQLVVLAIGLGGALSPPDAADRHHALRRSTASSR